MPVTKPEEIETDDVLVHRMLSGSTAAFDSLYERHFPKVYGFVARRVSQTGEVEDIVQTVFRHALTNLASYRSEGTFLRWLYGITRNVLRRHFLRKSRAGESLGRERLDVNDAPDLLQDDRTPERAASARQIGRRALGKLARLDPEARESYLRHHVDGFSIGELSEATARSEDALKSEFYRIRRKLADGD
ncbi:MAG: RNA polymerase sigma factor [Myxococcota bacterium]